MGCYGKETSSLVPAFAGNEKTYEFGEGDFPAEVFPIGI